MEDDEDDLYGSAQVGAVGTQPGYESGAATNGGNAQMKQENTGDGDDDEEEEDDEDDSDSDIDIITERKDGAFPDPPPQSQPFKRLKQENRTVSAEAIPTQRNQQPARVKSETPTLTKKVAIKDGSKYPEFRTSTIDVDSIPTWEPAGKPITEVDLDADIAMETKPWRVAGTDPTDFFNYGFDEFTWVQYCLKQQQMRDAISAQKAETKQFEAMLMQPAQPPPAGMPGSTAIPDMSPEMMNAMFVYMQQQGITDPGQLDFPTFMQHIQQMGGVPGMPGPGGPGGPGGQYVQNPHHQQGGQGYNGGYGGQPMQHNGSGQGYGGQQHSQSPYPGQQQQFGAGTPQPQQQGQPQGFEGYSAQQIAMMQGQGGGGGGGGRGRGRGRRW